MPRRSRAILAKCRHLHVHTRVYWISFPAVRKVLYGRLGGSVPMTITFESLNIESPKTTGRSILIVDDEPWIVNMLRDFLSTEHTCLTASSGAEALELLTNNDISVMLSDVNMPGMTGIELLSVVAAASPNTVCVVVSGEQTMETAIGALHVGAFDFIQKPFSLAALATVVESAMAKYQERIDALAFEQESRELVSRQRDQLQYLKDHDQLTGLVNRQVLTSELTQAMSDTHGKSVVALAMLSLDRFADIKRSLGSAIADSILRDIADRWIDIVPEGATLARLENDEFGLLLPDLDCSVDALNVLRELNRSLREPVRVAGHELSLVMNGGIGVFPNDGLDAFDLERAASIALGQARTSGFGSLKFHKPEMHRSATRRLKLECDLKRAVKAGELVNYYQPMVDFKSKQIVGMEALVRWNSREFGPVGASEIISAAESAGLIEPLGLQMLRSACRDTMALAKEGFDLTVSVNLSGKQLADSWFPRAVESVIAGSGLAADRLELEITETSLVENAEAAVTVLDALRSLGISIAIDDFGTGFSSLSYLKKFPLDTLKVDRSFISDIVSSMGNREFVEAIVALAHKLKLRTIVEGVETGEQLDVLERYGCAQWQGYLCSRPVPFEDLRALLSRQRDGNRALTTAG
jgi:diguanylate cyclase (GGDEF)-like protein